MKKEVKRDYIETSFPFPEISVFFIGIAALMVYPLAPPSKQWNDWVFFHFLLIAGILILSAPIVILDWPFHPRCSLSYQVGHREILGKARSYRVCCGCPSIGKVKVILERGGKAKWKYFCRYCDPSGPYFLKILKSRYAEVFVESAVRFRFVEKEIREGDQEGEGHEDEPPDIGL